MSYSPFETSVESSRPLELYTFTLGSETFRYHTTEGNLVIGPATYLAEAIRRGGIVQGGADSQDALLELEVPSTNEFARRYLSRIPGVRGELTLQRVQTLDFPTPEVVTLFQGFVQSVAFEDNGRLAKIGVTPTTAALSRAIPRFVYSSSCNHFLYDTGCQVDPEDPDFKLAGAIVTAIDGNVITVAGASGFPDGWFEAGFIEALGGADARMILDHTGDELTLLLPFTFDVVGQPVNVRAGCKHTISDCAAKFDNVINFGGFAFVPTKDLFEAGFD